MAYNGFISYSHAADGRLAPALQSGLQSLAKPWYRPRALRVFRDETGLSTNPHLWSSIATALDESEWFVLLASPESARSPWVDRELAHWLETKPADRILPALTSGEWGWDPECRPPRRRRGARAPAGRGQRGAPPSGPPLGPRRDRPRPAQQRVPLRRRRPGRARCTEWPRTNSRARTSASTAGLDAWPVAA